MRWIGIILVGVALAGAARGAENYPLLEQLNRETRSLYQEVQGGIVRVQLPTPRWIQEAAAADDPLRKWQGEELKPEVRTRIQEQRDKGLRTGQPAKIAPTVVPPAGAPTPSATPPATRPAGGSAGAGAGSGAASPPAVPGWAVTQRTAAGEIVLESRGGSTLVLHAGPEGRPAAPPATRPAGPANAPLHAAAPTFAPNNIGLLIDADGHVLVPLYLEKDAVGPEGVPMMVADRECVARFVGSDEKTNVTLLRIDAPGGRVPGRPVRLSDDRPAQGALVMLINPNGGAGRLMLWANPEREHGVVVHMDGSVAGITRFGQFLGGAASRPVIRQLIAKGKVERAVLGCRLTEVRAESPVRQANPALGDRPALVVDEVAPGSLAHRSGLARGDLIVELDGQVVGDLTTWSALSAGSGGDGQLRLLVVRGGRETTVTVNLPQDARRDE